MCRRFSITQEQGFTLIEVLIAATIGVIVIFGITLAYLSSLKAFKGGQGKVELQREAAYALETITNRVRGGNEVIVDYLGGGTNNNVEIQVKETPTTYYRYYLDPVDNSLRTTVQVGGGTPLPPVIIIPNSDNYTISSLNFQDPSGVGDGYGVTINLSLNGTGELSESVIFSTTAYVRVRK